MHDTGPSLTGRIDDVASFLGRSVRTLRRWQEETPPRIAYVRMGEDGPQGMLFLPDDVVRAVLAGRVEAEGSRPGQSAEVVLRAWRRHLEERSGASPVRPISPEDSITELRTRIEALERLVHLSTQTL